MNHQLPTYEANQKECASRGMLKTPISGMAFLNLVHVERFNEQEIVGVCLDIYSGYTLGMAVVQGRRQKALRETNLNQTKENKCAN